MVHSSHRSHRSIDISENEGIIIAIIAGAILIAWILFYLYNRCRRKIHCDTNDTKYMKGDFKNTNMGLVNGQYVWVRQVFEKYDENGCEVWITVS